MLNSLSRQEEEPWAQQEYKQNQVEGEEEDGSGE